MRRQFVHTLLSLPPSPIPPKRPSFSSSNRARNRETGYWRASRAAATTTAATTVAAAITVNQPLCLREFAPLAPLFITHTQDCSSKHKKTRFTRQVYTRLEHVEVTRVALQ